MLLKQLLLCFGLVEQTQNLKGNGSGLMEHFGTFKILWRNMEELLKTASKLTNVILVFGTMLVAFPIITLYAVLDELICKF